MVTKVDERQEETTFFKEELHALTQMNLENCTFTLALATHPGGKIYIPQYRSLNISQQVADMFADMAVRFVKGYLQSKALGLYKYSGGFRPAADDVEVLTVHGSLLETFINSTPAARNIDLLDMQQDDEFINSLRFYVFIVEYDGERVLFFRRYHRNKELKRSKNVFMRLVGTQFVLLDSPTFQFDEKFDAVLYHMHLYSFNKANFQYIFRFYELLRETAKNQLSQLLEAVPIANHEEFEESCLGHVAKLEKLRNIASKPYLSQISMADIKGTISEFELDVEVKEINGQEMLVYDSANQWAILNLLDDAYLVSHMTENMYEVTSKHLWNPPKPPSSV